MSPAQYTSLTIGNHEVKEFGGIAFEDDLNSLGTDLSSRDLEVNPGHYSHLHDYIAVLERHYSTSMLDPQPGANCMGFLTGDDSPEMDNGQSMKSLLVLARENLTLKQQLKTANQELSRLQVPSMNLLPVFRGDF